MGRLFAVKKVRKQMYPATHNFMDEADGTSGTDIEFVDTATLFDGACEIIPEWQGHKKVLRLTDDITAAQDPNIIHNITASTSGTHEFWIGTNDVTEEWGFRFREVNLTVLQFRITASKFQFARAGWHDVGKAAVNNVLYHCRLDWYADNTFDFWVDGVQYQDGEAVNSNMVGAGVNNFLLNCTGDSEDYIYLDAYGEGEDPDYNIGDNCFWRHYKESTDSFEGDDVRTIGTSITWVDGVNTAADHEIVAEFNEHKKILKTIRAAGTGVCYHTFASQSTAGWVAGWLKASDANAINGIIQLAEDANLRIKVQIDNDRFEYDAGAGMVAVGVAAVDATWYFVYLQWYADDTFDLWVNNVQYLDGVSTFANFTGSGVNNWYINLASASPATTYLDAPISSLDGDSRGDNRTFDYNDSYTREDITTEVSDLSYSNVLHGWRTGTLFSKVVYYNAEVFFQIYDVNSKLSMEADLTNRIQNGAVYTYPLLDKNLDDLLKESNNTFSAAKIHDPTDSGCMLKTILPNVSEADGDLILVDADTKTDTYSPVTKNYLDLDALRDISDLADSVVIVQADGKCYLDDDKASGDSLDLDVAADKLMMTKEPVPNDIVGVNYWEVFGAMNPDTGTRFYKIVDSSGSDKKRRWRITNNSFRTQTDVDAYATKLSARVVSVKEIIIFVQGLGTHNMGETFDYKYVNSVVNIPQADYYVISETVNMDTAEATIVLSEGLVELSKYASGFERPQNYSDAFASEIYETDINTINLNVWASVAITTAFGIILNNGDKCYAGFYISEKVDISRDITIHFLWYDAHLTIDGEIFIVRYPCDGSSVGVLIQAATDHDITVTVDARFQNTSYTIDSSDVVADNQIQIQWESKDADPVQIAGIQIEYYVKRSV